MRTIISFQRFPVVVVVVVVAAAAAAEIPAAGGRAVNFPTAIPGVVVLAPVLLKHGIWYNFVRIVIWAEASLFKS